MNRGPSSGDLRFAAAVATVLVFLAFGTIPAAIELLQAEREYASDFRRDVIGSELAAAGETPYQRVYLRIGPETHPTLGDEGWIAHSPVSIAVAGALSSTADESTVETWLEILALLSPAVLAMVLIRISVGTRWTRLGIVAVTVLGIPALENVTWLQTSGALALALVAVLLASERGHLRRATVLLGLLTAIKVWPAFLALMLRGRRIENTLWVAGVSAGLTLVALPLIGGVSVLGDWVLTALPENVDEFLGSSFSALSAAGLPAYVRLVAYVSAMAIAALVRTTPENRVGFAAALHFALAPLVWPWMVLALLPALLWPVIRVRATPIVTLACFALPVFSVAPGLPIALGISHEISRYLIQVGQVVSIGLWIAVLWSSRHAHPPRLDRFRESTRGQEEEDNAPPTR